MSSLFLTLRYIAFACFILFNSVICVVAALNLGSLIVGIEKLPQIDAYLIFTGAFTIAFVFPVIFIELFRRDAFVCRVAVEIAWVAIFWIMALSGAAAVTAVSCQPSGLPFFTACTSRQVLVAFTWLSTITFLAYLLGLIICAVYHSQEDSHVWQRGVRSFRWFSPTKLPANPPSAAFSYGKITDLREPPKVHPIYSQQIGLPRSYVVEPLQVNASAPPPVPQQPSQPQQQQQHPIGLRHDFKFPAEPMPVATGPPPRLHINTSFDPPAPPPIAATSHTYPSLYPQFVRASGGKPAQPPPHDGPTPPPLGEWPRPNPQEPQQRRKSRPQSHPEVVEPQNMAQVISSTTRPLPDRTMSREMATIRPLPPVTRPSRPAGPRNSSLDRHRPPPLDLSRISSSKQS